MNTNKNAMYQPNGRRDEDEDDDVNANVHSNITGNGGNEPAAPSRPPRSVMLNRSYAAANGVNGHHDYTTDQVEMLADSTSEDSDADATTLSLLDYYAWPQPPNRDGCPNGHSPNGGTPEGSSTDSPPRTISTDSSFSATGQYSWRLSHPAHPAHAAQPVANTSADRLSGSTLYDGRGVRLHALGPPVVPTPNGPVVTTNGRFVRDPGSHPHPNLLRRDPARAPTSLAERVLALAVPYFPRAAQAAVRASSRTLRDVVDAEQVHHIVLSYTGNGRVAVRARGGHRLPAVDSLALGPVSRGEALAARRILRILESSTRVVDVLGNIPTEPTRPGILFPLAFAALSHLRIIPAPAPRRGYLPWFPFPARKVVLFSSDLVPVRMCPTLIEACHRWATYSPRRDTERVVVVHDGVAISLRACWDGLEHETAQVTLIWQPQVADRPRAPLVPVTLRVLNPWQWDVVAELALAFPVGDVHVVGLDTADLSDVAAADLAASAASNNCGRVSLVGLTPDFFTDNTRWIGHNEATFRRIRLLSMSEYADGMDEDALLLDTTTGF